MGGNFKFYHLQLTNPVGIPKIGEFFPLGMEVQRSFPTEMKFQIIFLNHNHKKVQSLWPKEFKVCLQKKQKDQMEIGLRRVFNKLQEFFTYVLPTVLLMLRLVMSLLKIILSLKRYYHLFLT